MQNRRPRESWRCCSMAASSRAQQAALRPRPHGRPPQPTPRRPAPESAVFVHLLVFKILLSQSRFGRVRRRACPEPRRAQSGSLAPLCARPRSSPLGAYGLFPRCRRFLKRTSKRFRTALKRDHRPPSAAGRATATAPPRPPAPPGLPGLRCAPAVAEAPSPTLPCAGAGAPSHPSRLPPRTLSSHFRDSCT